MSTKPSSWAFKNTRERIAVLQNVTDNHDTSFLMNPILIDDTRNRIFMNVIKQQLNQFGNWKHNPTFLIYIQTAASIE